MTCEIKVDGPGTYRGTPPSPWPGLAVRRDGLARANSHRRDSTLSILSSAGSLVADRGLHLFRPPRASSLSMRLRAGESPLGHAGAVPHLKRSP